MTNLAITVLCTMAGLHWFGPLSAGIAFVASGFFVVIDSSNENLRRATNNLKAIVDILRISAEAEAEKEKKASE